MAREDQPAVTIHQCLFGYNDGHRLLASSLKLPAEASSTLLLLSDLATGVRFGELDGYWTGVPLPAAKRYALMRTWPAPEMPRPGCVWTHAVIVSFVDLGRFVDLGVLRSLVARPTTSRRYEDYGHVIILDAPVLESTDPVQRDRRVSVRDALKLIRAVYGARSPVALTAKPDELDDATFALWSQQWPRLRRSFAFRTAGSLLEEPLAGPHLDLALAFAPERGDGPSLDLSTEPQPWEAAAVADLRSIQPTEFRHFLWRYGSDIRRGRERFRTLADLYVRTRVRTLADPELEAVLTMVATEIPSTDEGRTLKEDLMSCGRRTYSLVPPVEVLDVLEFFVSHPNIEGLPAPSAEVFVGLQQLWASRSDRILSLAERAAERRSEIGEAILDRLATIVDPVTFLARTRNRPSVQLRLVCVKPELLLSEDLAEVPQPQLSRLLALAPDDARFGEQLLPYLLRRDDADVAAAMCKRFLQETLRVAGEALRRAVEDDGPELSPAWMGALAHNRTELLQAGVVERTRSTRYLAMLARLLQYDSPEVVRAGPAPWVAGLRTASDDLGGGERQVFLAFLLAIAIRNPVSGSEMLFERAFESVHNDLWYSRFAYEAASILERHLPNLSWWEQWDTCKRLRMAVVSAYASGELDPSSFARLTHDRRLWERLTNLAERTSGGRRLLEKVMA